MKHFILFNKKDLVTWTLAPLDSLSDMKLHMVCNDNYLFLLAQIVNHHWFLGFDDQGRQFDLNGNLVDWWKSETKEHYLEKAKCIIEQYGNYTEPSTGLKVWTIRSLLMLI